MKWAGLHVLVVYLLLGVPSLHAQEDPFPFEFGMGLSWRNFEWIPSGSLERSTFYPITNYSLSARVRPQLDMALQGGSNMLRLAEPGRKESHSELDWTLRYFPLSNPSTKNHRLLSPYLIGGIGSSIRGKGPKELNFHLPMGIGLTFRPQKQSIIQIQAVYKLSEVADFVAVTAGIGFRFGKSKPKDKDQDGIPDREDKCPLVPGLIAFGGCADTDEDGVPDQEDPCPLIAGLLIDKGCPPPPPDSDGDGTIDAEDGCPLLAGSISAGGCPDQDGDGLRDSLDVCPDQAGKPSLQGCPDTDNDGVPDEKDQCPDKVGDFTTGGCPDADLDGIRDLEDECPVDPGPLSNKGCPLITTRGSDELAFQAKHIKFEQGSANLLESSHEVLDEVIRILTTYSSFQLEIIGHTDATGEEETNLQLSQKRAQTCLEYLIAKGVSAHRVKAIGKGESQPIADNTTPEGREKNRRVEFSLQAK